MFNIPKQLQHRPVDERGYVITYVTLIDPTTHKPDFRSVDAIRVKRCVDYRLCGICGEEIDKICAFIGGPESVANKMFSDPPMHPMCADYSMKVCPYLANKNAKHVPTEMIRNKHPDIVIIENCLAGMVRPDKLAIYLTKTYKGVLVAASPKAVPHLGIKVGKQIGIRWF